MNLAMGQRTTRVLFIAAAGILLLWGILYTKAFASSVSVSWTYDYGPEPACSATQTSSCIDHFEVEDITNQQSFVLIQKVPNPPMAEGKIDHISTAFKYGPPFGQRTISVVAVGKDSNGRRVTSNPFAARATVMTRPTAKVSVVL